MTWNMDFRREKIMPKRMLIDATHPEETRVVVADGTELLEYDYETSTKRQIKSNIYLAKVTRVEPSLQAAFVDFGGNRHGFLAFNEIHPDYYQIPIEDREKLLADSDKVEDDEENGEPDEIDETNSKAADSSEAADDTEPTVDDDLEDGSEGADVVGESDDEDIREMAESHRRRLRKLTRSYKIQEVIKRRQILLVQVVKEERGNKGAALTTYLSLPGRYCVLMPNTSRGGGVSRKITDPKHRKAMKIIMSEMEVPDGMAVIMRTAGVERTKSEIKRDYEYLRRVWDEAREMTMNSSAPSLIYEEGDVIKRALRDIYDRDIDEVLIEGDEAYKAAKALMRTMIPSHAKRVQKYEDKSIPLFNRYQIDQQLDEIHEPIVQLESGGYLVINPTEALVAIDVNSGRSTRERNVEQTAYRTNLEAADEVARQLRLRDLAGLVVIDFIDMDVSRNNHAVERRVKEAMKTDRARIQIGRISSFGLMELSRQRLRSSLHEAHAQICPICKGSGFVRSTESTTMAILRELEEEGLRKRSEEVTVKAQTDIALYLLNQKRDTLREIEDRHKISVLVLADPGLAASDYQIGPSHGHGGDENKDDSNKGSPHSVEKREDDAPQRRRRRGGRKRSEESSGETESDSTTEAAETTNRGTSDGGDEDSGKRNGRRRGRRGGRRRQGSVANKDAQENLESLEVAAENLDITLDPDAEVKSGHDDGDAPKRRRRPRRRGRRTPDNAENETTNAESTVSADSEVGEVDTDIGIPVPSSTATVSDNTTSVKAEAPAVEAESKASTKVVKALDGEDPAESKNTAEVGTPKQGAKAKAQKKESVPDSVEEKNDDRPRRSGWWSRS
jgi:ribonuclease E